MNRSIEDDMHESTTETNNSFNNRVIGNQVIVRQGGARYMEADHLLIRQGGAMSLKATRLDITQGGVVLAQTDAASMNTSQAFGVIAGGDVHIDQSLTHFLITKGASHLDQSAVGLLVANDVKVEKATSIFLLAKRVEGNLTTLFGPREALIFGVLAGIVGGFVTVLIKLFQSRKKGHDGNR